ncbi:Zn-ribbon domain-containing OB-fold protein [Hydrogenophaga sp. BPS33]|uniref:Zn-ribbon domain-containing OB-fold protein n=1 Tax=Hydrogenophaga sp. BPS33 TaxID=2651974 RepID=UPI0013204217|nr:OB-fold domain-containing protein [Hydrogenophaga sp. BPS33]QHE87870.1 DNA-binding protein [Hydrogenophaga sp. BPS33]
MTSQPQHIYPDPLVNSETAPYWQACQAGTLQLKRCNACGQTHFYPRAVCPFCLSGDTVWFTASGLGRVYAFSVMRRAEPPYAIAYVTLDEGVTLMTHIVDCAFDGIAIGQRVALAFRQSAGGQAVPVFRPQARLSAEALVGSLS